MNWNNDEYSNSIGCYECAIKYCLPLNLGHKFDKYYWTDINLNTGLFQSIVVVQPANWRNAKNNHSMHLSIAILSVYYCKQNLKSATIVCWNTIQLKISKNNFKIGFEALTYVPYTQKMGWHQLIIYDWR